MSNLDLGKLKKKSPGKPAKVKKVVDRFNGLSEEEVQKFTLPDILDMNLDIIFIGINPGLMSAYRRRYYAGPGNHFYKLLHASGLLPVNLSFEQDYKLLEYGIGLTNIVSRATKSSSELTKAEIKEGAAIVEQKIQHFKPKVAVFNGKCIYEVYANVKQKQNFCFGLQQKFIGNTVIWVVPSSSARCSNFPRMDDKLHFYVALKKYLQYIKGEISDVKISDFVFEGKCKQAIPSTSKMWRRKNVSAFLHGGRIANKETFSLDTSDEAVACSTEFVLNKIKNDENIEDSSCNDIDVTTDNCKTDEASTKDVHNVKSSIKRKLQCDGNQKKETSFDYINLIKLRILAKQQLDTSFNNTEKCQSRSKKLNFKNLKKSTSKINTPEN